MVKQSHYSRSISEHNVSGLVSHKLLKRVQAYHQYGVSSRPALYIANKGCTRPSAASDKVYQLLVHGRYFSPGTPASSTTKTGCHNIPAAEILLKVALSTIYQINSIFKLFLMYISCCICCLRKQNKEKQ